ncbi:hypothetical protein KCU93_g5414, partial [Aureobasidium melanogenum]
MSGTQTSTRPRHTREVSTKATGTIKDINEGAEFAQRVLYMFETVVELVNKVLIFPTKFSTQKQELKAEQQRTAATFLKSQDNIRIALNKPGLTKEEIEEILRDVKEEQGKDWPEKSEANQHMFMFNAWIYKPPESFVVKGLLDTGADVSWISIDALRRANLTTGIKRVTNLQEFVGVDGKKVQSLGKITIQWWYTGVEAINQTEFFVIENLGDELDMIVGTEDIIKHELVVLKSATRVLRKYNKPKDIAKAADRANKFDALNEVLNKELEKQELKKFEEKQEELRGGSGAAGPSSPASSTNTTKSHSRPGPPPIPPKSANVIARGFIAFTQPWTTYFAFPIVKRGFLGRTVSLFESDYRFHKHPSNFSKQRERNSKVHCTSGKAT